MQRLMYTITHSDLCKRWIDFLQDKNAGASGTIWQLKLRSVVLYERLARIGDLDQYYFRLCAVSDCSWSKTELNSLSHALVSMYRLLARGTARIGADDRRTYSFVGSSLSSSVRSSNVLWPILTKLLADWVDDKSTIFYESTEESQRSRNDQSSVLSQRSLKWLIWSEVCHAISSFQERITSPE